MNDPQLVKPYKLKLLERVAFHDERSHLFFDWPANAIIGDPAAIEMIEARAGWTVERIPSVP
jgi:hypothetical protein